MLITSLIIMIVSNYLLIYIILISVFSNNCDCTFIYLKKISMRLEIIEIVLETIISLSCCFDVIFKNIIAVIVYGLWRKKSDKENIKS